MKTAILVMALAVGMTACQKDETIVPASVPSPPVYTGGVSSCVPTLDVSFGEGGGCNGLVSVETKDWVDNNVPMGWRVTYVCGNTSVEMFVTFDLVVGQITGRANGQSYIVVNGWAMVCGAPSFPITYTLHGCP